MKLFLHILNGPSKGKKFVVREGMILGRRNADIIIPDPSTSTIHAEIISRPGRRLFLADRNSKNGSKVNGLRVDDLALEAGLQFQIGKTDIAVEAGLIDTTPLPVKKSPPPPPAEIGPIASMNNAQEIVINDNPEWFEVLENYSQQIMDKIKNKPNKKIKAFNPAIKLDFIRGVQVDTSLTLGYGPRSFGRSNYEHTIFEAYAPDDCFELLPDKKGVLFKTQHPKRVQLNNKAISSEILKNGDIISIYNTLIKVGLIK